MPIERLTADLVRDIIGSYGQIRKLNLASNAIARVEHLGALSALTKLSLAGNRLQGGVECLGGLSDLPLLEELDLSDNRIDVLAGLAAQRMPSLRRLELSGNGIAEMEQVSKLSRFESLESLNLSGNPVCAQEGYRADVARMLPDLHELDGLPLKGGNVGVRDTQELLDESADFEVEASGDAGVAAAEYPSENQAFDLGGSDRDGEEGGEEKQEAVAGELRAEMTQGQEAEDEEVEAEAEDEELEMEVEEAEVEEAEVDVEGEGECASEAGSAVLGVKASTVSVVVDSSAGIAEEIGNSVTQEVGAEQKLDEEEAWEGTQSVEDVMPNRLEVPSSVGSDITSRSTDDPMPLRDDLRNPNPVTPNDMGLSGPPGLIAHFYEALQRDTSHDELVPSEPSGSLSPILQTQRSFRTQASDVPEMELSELRSQERPSQGGEWQASSENAISRSPPLGSAFAVNEQNINRPHAELTEAPVSALSEASYSPQPMQGSGLAFPPSGLIYGSLMAPEQEQLLREISLLSQQNRALKAAAATQDSVLAHTHRSRPRPWETKPAEREGESRGEEDTVDDYVQLLTRWREEVLRLLTEREEEKAQHEESVKVLNEKVIQISNQRQAAAQSARVAESRCAAAEAGAELLQARAASLVDQLRAAEGRCSAVERELAHHRAVNRQLKALLSSFRESASEGYYDRSSHVAVALSKLESFEARLKLAAAHIKMMHTLQKRKDVQLRNSRAALEADKRIWRTERERRELAALVAAGGGPFSTSAKGGDLPQEGGYVWSRSSRPERRPVIRGLRAECEAVMRAVFCKLDRQGKGVVDGHQLVEALKGDRIVQRVMSGAFGQQKWAHALRGIESQLADAAAGAAEPELTWGEFLLFFIPYPAARPRSSSDDMLLVKWATADEGLLAQLHLALPEPERDSAETIPPPLGALSVHELRQEVRRLSCERSFLMELVREDGAMHGLRSEEIYDAYRHELSHVRARVRELESLAQVDAQALRAAQRRAEIAEGTVTERANRDTEADEAWKRRMAAADAAYEKAHDELRAQARYEADQAREKVSKLEAEVAVLKRENAKSNVAHRAMERELNRVKQAREEEVQQIRGDLGGKLASRDRELMATRRERSALLAFVREQQQKGLLSFSRPLNPAAAAGAAAAAESNPPFAPLPESEGKAALQQKMLALNTLAGAILLSDSDEGSSNGDCDVASVE